MMQFLSKVLMSVGLILYATVCFIYWSLDLVGFWWLLKKTTGFDIDTYNRSAM
jgi:hypothetical protein